MEVELTEMGHVQIAALSGELDNQSAEEVQAQLLPLVQPDCRVLLDMSNVAYISSVGLRVLLLLYRRIDAVGGRVVLYGLQEIVRDTMQITGFLQFFQAAPDLQRGLQMLDQPKGA